MEKNNKIQKFNFPENGKLTAHGLTELLKNTCHYVEFVEFTKNSKEQLVVLIYPDKAQLEQPDYKKTPEEGCFCPRSLDEVGRCLKGCLNKVNNELLKTDTRIDLALIVGEKNMNDNGQLTLLATEKLNKIIEQYMYKSTGDDIYIIDLETTTILNK